MSGCSSRQRREFLLDGLVEGVRGRKRTRRLNRRKDRHVAPEPCLAGGSYVGDNKAEVGGSPLCSRPKRVWCARIAANWSRVGNRSRKAQLVTRMCVGTRGLHATAEPLLPGA